MPKVSVIIPVYNAEPYIEQCINSILAQTLKDIEIIIINDGSTDGTPEIVKQLIAGHSNVTFYSQENKGLYSARERGLSFATGEYIGWVDADDFVELEMYEVLYETALKNDSELVFCDYKWFPDKIRTKEKWYRPYLGKVDTFFVERNSQPWNKIVKRELLERLNISSYFVPCFDEIYIRVLMEARNPVSVDKELYDYRVGGGTMSSSYTNIVHYQRFVDASKELRKLMKSIVKDAYWVDYFDYRVAYYLLMTMLVAANSGDKEAYEQSRRELKAMKPKYASNQHYWRILNENYGRLKATVIGGVIPMGYGIAHLACKVGIK